VAAALLGEPERGQEAERLLSRARELLAPSHWKAELANVLWKAVRLERLSIDMMDAVISTAGELPITSVDVSELWRGAIARGVAANHPVYDTLFVELAVRERTVVVSYDRLLQRRFPQTVRTPGRVLRRPFAR
jgi:predicted nucleic acid-binding protein